MTIGRLFWAVILGVITIVLADFVGTVLKARPGYKTLLTKFGGADNG